MVQYSTTFISSAQFTLFEVYKLHVQQYKVIFKFCCSKCSRIGIYDQRQQAQVAAFNSHSRAIKSSFHLLFHILGRYHEYQRPDRDQHIRVQWDNIKEGNPS